MSSPVPAERVRNIGIIAHIDAGKTTVTERVLFHTGDHVQNRRRPRRHCRHGLDGAGARARHHDHRRRHHSDVEGLPGQHRRHARPRRLHGRSRAKPPRSRRRRCCIRRRRRCQSQSETVWRQADRYHIPRICFINKMDRVGADFWSAVHMIRERLNARPVVVQMPIGAGGPASPASSTWSRCERSTSLRATLPPR